MSKKIPNYIFIQMLQNENIEAKASFLHQNYKIPLSISNSICSVNPVRHEDLLKVPELTKKENRKLLFQLLKQPAFSSEIIQTEIVEVNAFQSNGLTIKREKVLEYSREYLQLSLSDTNGILVSVRLNSENKFDWASLQFFNTPISKLWQLSKAQTLQLGVRLHHISSEKLENIVNGVKIPDDEFNEYYKVLGLSLLRLQYLSASASDRKIYQNLLKLNYDPIQASTSATVTGVVTGFPSTHVPSEIVTNPTTGNEKDCSKDYNGCGPEGFDIVPELNFHDCCVQHDICYCRGCSDCDRVNCDEDFLDCMTKTGDVHLAYIYYAMVRAIGAIPFDECGKDSGLGGLLSSIIAIGAVLTFNPVIAILGVITSLILSNLNCNICNLVENSIQYLTELLNFRLKINLRSLQQKRTQCKKTKGFFKKLKCWFTLIITFLIWFILLIIISWIAFILKIISWLTCG